MERTNESGLKGSVPWDRLFSVPNGASMSSKRHAAGQIGQGLSRGVPDLVFPLGWSKSFGLWVELKKDTGRVRPEQAEWLDWLDKNGHTSVVCWTLEEAVRVVLIYGVTAAWYRREETMGGNGKRNRLAAQRRRIIKGLDELNGGPVESVKVMAVKDEYDWPMVGMDLEVEGLLAMAELQELNVGDVLQVGNTRAIVSTRAYPETPHTELFGYVLNKDLLEVA